MQIEKITILLASLLFCWGQVLAKYEFIVTAPTTPNQCDGFITATATGNAGPYEFVWFEDNGTPVAENLVMSDNYSSTLNNYCSGIYEVVVTNRFGCETVLFEKTDVELSVFLEGAYKSSLAEMETQLSSIRKILPGQTPTNSLVSGTPEGQPYTAKPWEYKGKEGIGWTKYQLSKNYENIVDWVLVSLRNSKSKNTVIETRAGLLNKNGSILFPEKFNKLSGVDSVFVVVEHRNHLGIMSPEKIKISNNTLSHDFTTQNSNTGNNTRTGQKEVDSGKWLMFAGDCEQNSSKSDINGDDKRVWEPQNGNFDKYLSGDFNLNGDTNGEDKLIWGNANGISGILGDE